MILLKNMVEIFNFECIEHITLKQEKTNTTDEDYSLIFIGSSGKKYRIYTFRAVQLMPPCSCMKIVDMVISNIIIKENNCIGHEIIDLREICDTIETVLHDN